MLPVHCVHTAELHLCAQKASLHLFHHTSCDIINWYEFHGCWIAWLIAVGMVQASADTQGALLPGQGSAASDYSPSPVVGLQQAGAAGAQGNVTAHVVTLERLAHDLQQHLAGE